MRFPSPIVTAAIVVLAFGGATALAQAPVSGAASGAEPQPIAGWTFIPSVGYAGAWDDNVLVRGTGDTMPSAYTDTINPRALLEFNSRRMQFLSSYDGAFTAYRDLSMLNSFDQRASLSVRRYATQHLAVFASGSATSTPTTELLGLVAVPFVRLGSRLVDTHSGVEMAFTKRTSMVASLNLQWVDFDPDPLLGLELLGGHAQGGDVSVKHLLSQRFALTGSYEMTRATVTGNSHFNVQNGDGGIELQPSHALKLYGAIGFSRLEIEELVTRRTGLSWRAGVSRRFRRGAVAAGYSRSFVPSYSFGGTTQNEELTSSLQMPFGRRFYTRSAFSWRRNEPLTVGGLRLKSIWVDGAVGYSVRPWMQVEGFYGGTHQNIDRPGGELNRNRAGFQVITAKPVRIR